MGLDDNHTYNRYIYIGVILKILTLFSNANSYKKYHGMI